MKIKNFFSKIKYAIIPFIIFIIVLFLSFFGVEMLYKAGLINASQYHLSIFDQYIPLVPEFIYVYFLTFPLGIVLFFYLAYSNKKAFYNLYVTLVISFAISGFIYFFAETILTKPDFDPVSFTDKLLVWTWGSTAPVNNFPSQHCFMAIAIIIGCLTANGKGKERKMNKIFIYASVIISLLICMSTVFTKQHYFLDILGSFDIMLIVYSIVRVCGTGDKLANWQEKREEKRKVKKIEKQMRKESENAK